MRPKEEWLRHCGFNYSDQDRWLRDKIASLFDLKEPTEAQRRLMKLADLHLTCLCRRTIRS
jgi:hypothetical protein